MNMKKKVGFEKFVAGISVLSGMLWLSASLCPVQTQAAVDGAREVMHYNINEAGMGSIIGLRIIRW